VVRHDVTAVRKGFAADSTFRILVGDLVGEQLLHFCVGPDFAIAPGMMRVFDALNASDQSESPCNAFAPTTEKRLVNRASFSLAEFHGVCPPIGLDWKSRSVLGELLLTTG
jgi:hypothetical protein